MRGKPRKGPREKDLTGRYLSGGLDEDRVDAGERFKARNKSLQQDKIARTAVMRAAEQEAGGGGDIESLPTGEVIQVHSLYSDVQSEGVTYLCVLRKTLMKLRETSVVVGDRVRFRDVTTRDADGKAGGDPAAPPDGVIEQILPRDTILTRADSFKGHNQHPIVANASQMLIVASLRQPRVKWGLVDRMLVAAESGGLKPIVCLNKIDLAGGAGDGESERPADLLAAEAALRHYAGLGVPSFQASVSAGIGLDALRDALRDRTTVLAGHSGVGKSSLIRAIQSDLDIRIGDVSRYTEKGRHTTSSARRYPLDFGGAVIDTPGVKVFGLWGVTRDNAAQFFPDVQAGNAPDWRKESCERIVASLPDSQDDRS